MCTPLRFEFSMLSFPGVLWRPPPLVLLTCVPLVLLPLFAPYPSTEFDYDLLLMLCGVAGKSLRF